MDLILLLVLLLRSTLASSTAALPPDWNCASPTLRATMNAAIQEKLALLDMGGMPQAPKVLEGLHEASSPRAMALAHLLESTNNLSESTSKVCEVSMPGVDDAMFATVLFINPSTGEPGGVIFNLGLGPVTVNFGSTSK